MIFDKIQSIRYSLYNMIFGRYNTVRLTKFRSKDWIETDERLIESIFELLRDYIEEQVAWREVIFGDAEYNWWTRFQMKYIPNRFRRQLSRTLALRYLDWEINASNNPPQAESAQKQKDLYLWYLDVYNVAVDPYSVVSDAPGKLLDFKSDPDNPNYRILDLHQDDPEWAEYWVELNAAGDECDRRYSEATDKSMEVLKIRSSLWT